MVWVTSGRRSTDDAQEEPTASIKPVFLLLWLFPLFSFLFTGHMNGIQLLAKKKMEADLRERLKVQCIHRKKDTNFWILGDD